jgi:hypothetical protein
MQGVQFAVGIPEDPTDADIARILLFLEQSAHIEWIRGLREKEPLFTTRLRWLDTFLDYDPELRRFAAGIE